MSDPLASRPFLNLEEAAALVGLKPPTLRRAIRLGELAYARPGRAYLVRPADVIAWLENQIRCGGVRLVAKKAACRSATPTNCMTYYLSAASAVGSSALGQEKV